MGDRVRGRDPAARRRHQWPRGELKGWDRRLGALGRRETSAAARVEADVESLTDMGNYSESHRSGQTSEKGLRDVEEGTSRGDQADCDPNRQGIASVPRTDWHPENSREDE
jgi:hypothetical protein